MTLSQGEVSFNFMADLGTPRLINLPRKWLSHKEKYLLISWLKWTSAVFLEPRKIKSVSVSIISQLFSMKWWDWMPWSWFSECWVWSQLFTLLFQFHQETLQFLFAFCPERGVICISDVMMCFPESWFQLVLLPAHHLAWWKVKVNAAQSCPTLCDPRD